MKKRMGIMLLVLMMVWGTKTQVFAFGEQGTIQSIVESRYMVITVFDTGFVITDDNLAEYNSTVSTYGATKTVVYMELQEQSGSSWTKVDSATSTSTKGSFSLDKSTRLDTFNTLYRVYFKATVYYGDGKVETATDYIYDKN